MPHQIKVSVTPEQRVSQIDNSSASNVAIPVNMPNQKLSEAVQEDWETARKVAQRVSMHPGAAKLRFLHLRAFTGIAPHHLLRGMQRLPDCACVRNSSRSGRCDCSL